jgi:hypothetical protein
LGIAILKLGSKLWRQHAHCDNERRRYRFYSALGLKFATPETLILKLITRSFLLLLSLSPGLAVSSAFAQQSQHSVRSPIESLENTPVAPVVLCIDDKPLTGVVPSSEAYSKAAMNGFRSILTLRSRKDGVDLTRERLTVEHNKLRYFNILYHAEFPQGGQVDEFLRLARDPLNQPMLVNCAFAERVAPLMMMFRIVEQGWSEDRAVEEAGRSGLESAKLRRFADNYLARQKKPGTKSARKS